MAEHVIQVDITDNSANKQPSAPAQEVSQQPNHPQESPPSRQELEKWFGVKLSAPPQSSVAGDKIVEKRLDQITAKSKTVVEADPDIQKEADRRLKRIAREKEIDKVMRSQDDEYEKIKDKQDEERARVADLRLTTQQERDENWVDREELRKLKQVQRMWERAVKLEAAEDKRIDSENKHQEKLQERNEDLVARQEKRSARREILEKRQQENQQERDENGLTRDNRLAEKREIIEKRKHENRQERDENWLARDQLREFKLAQKEVKLVPEVIPLHDEEAYAKNARAAMADRERAKRQKEVRREIDPEFAKEEQDRESKERAKLLAMGGAAIGGKVGRMMGIASQLMGSPEAMRALAGLVGGNRRETATPVQESRPTPDRNIVQPDREQATPKKEVTEKPAVEAPDLPMPAKKQIKQLARKERQRDLPRESILGPERREVTEKEPERPGSLFGKERKPPEKQVTEKEPESQQEKETRKEEAENTPEKEVAEKTPPSRDQEKNIQANPPSARPSAMAVNAGQPPAGPTMAAAKSAPSANAASSAATAAGAGTAAGGAMAAATAMIPVVGAIIAAVELTKQVIAEVGEGGRKIVRGGVDASKAVVSGDIDQRMAVLVGGFDAVADGAAKVVPVLGLVTPAAKEFVRGIDEMRGTVKQTTERLSQYNGKLASQVAMQEVTEMIRDINRANRMGGQLAATNDARFRMEQKMQDIADKLMPTMLSVTEDIFKTIEGLMTMTEKMVEYTGITAGKVSDVAKVAIPGWAVMAILLRKIQEQAEQNNNATITEDAGWNQFLALRNPGALSTVVPPPPMPGPVVGMP